MSILSDFEDRVASLIEGLFAGAFRSPVQPAEIAKALAKAMDDGRKVGVGKVYVPTCFDVLLSEEDGENLAPLLPGLGDELAIYLADHARERSYHLTENPEVGFAVASDLRLGRFEVEVGGTPPGPPPSLSEKRPPHRGGQGWQSRMATVTVEGTEHDVALAGDSAVIGRLADSDIVLTDANVSRHHAAMQRRADGWWLVDLESTNGTMLNGKPVTEARLRDGDVIFVGATRLRFNEPKG